MARPRLGDEKRRGSSWDLTCAGVRWGSPLHRACGHFTDVVKCGEGSLCLRG